MTTPDVGTVSNRVAGICYIVSAIAESDLVPAVIVRAARVSAPHISTLHHDFAVVIVQKQDLRRFFDNPFCRRQRLAMSLAWAVNRSPYRIGHHTPNG